MFPPFLPGRHLLLVLRGHAPSGHSGLSLPCNNRRCFADSSALSHCLVAFCHLVSVLSSMTPELATEPY